MSTVWCMAACLCQTAPSLAVLSAHPREPRYHQHYRGVLPRRRTCLVDGPLVCPDLDYLIARDEPVGVGLDRLGQHLVDGHGISGESGGSDHLAASEHCYLLV